jgi:hypothetical protein
LFGPLYFGDWDLFVFWILKFEFSLNPNLPVRVNDHPDKSGWLLLAAKGRYQKKAPLVPTSLGARTTCKARGLKIDQLRTKSFFSNCITQFIPPAG